MNSLKLKDAAIIIAYLMVIEMLLTGSLQVMSEYNHSKYYGVTYYFGRTLAMGFATLLAKILFGYYPLIFLYLYNKNITMRTFRPWAFLIPVTFIFTLSLLILFITTGNFFEGINELKIQFRRDDWYFRLFILLGPIITAPFIIKWIHGLIR